MKRACAPRECIDGERARCNCSAGLRRCIWRGGVGGFASRRGLKACVRAGGAFQLEAMGRDRGTRGISRENTEREPSTERGRERERERERKV